MYLVHFTPINNFSKIRMLRFNRTYFLLTILLLLIEILIALYAQDNMIRPYVGDLLVVILLYCLSKSFLNVSSLTIAVAVLCFAYVVEFLQYLQFVKRIGLQHSAFACIILGNAFEWLDMLAYTLGMIITLAFEKSRHIIKPNVK